MVRHRWEMRTEPNARGGGGARFRVRLGRGAIMCLLFTAVIWIAASLLFHPPEGAGDRLGAVDMDPSGATGTTPAAPGPSPSARTAPPPAPQPADGRPSASASAPPGEPGGSIVVHVAGAVKKPGVYRFAPGTRAGDAVARAGGPTAHAVASAVNLAAPLQDGEQLYLPTRAEVATSVAAPPAAQSPAGGADGPGTGGLDINSSTATELEQLPGIGPALSARIVEFRTANGPFASLEELDAVPGIGPAMMSRLKPLVRFR